MRLSFNSSVLSFTRSIVLFRGAIDTLCFLCDFGSVTVFRAVTSLKVPTFLARLREIHLALAWIFLLSYSCTIELEGWRELLLRLCIWHLYEPYHRDVGRDEPKGRHSIGHAPEGL